MSRQHNDEPLSNEAQLLIRYLEQYPYAQRKLRILERRRRTIIRDFDHPVGGINYDGMPKGSTISVGAASLALKLDDIDTQIIQQKNNSAKLILDIMDIMNFLPENEAERDVLEARYIDCLCWRAVCKEVHMSRSAAYKYLKDGINKLLSFKKIQKIVKDYKASMIDRGEIF